MSRSGRPRWALTALIWAAAGVALVPFAHLVAGAFKPIDVFYAGPFLPPGDGLLGVAWDRLGLDNFRRLFLELELGRSLLNSVFLASVTSVLATLASALGGWALVHFRFRGRGAVTGVVLAALLVPGPLLLAPGYLWLHRLDLLDTWTALVLPACGSAFGVFLFRQAFLRSVPSDVLDAARLDGCGEAGLFFRIALPLVRPMVGAFLTLTFLGTWNSFVWPQVVLQSADKLPLSVAVANLRGIYGQDLGLQMAATVVAIAPVAGLFLLLQRELVDGLTAGAVRG